MCDALDASYVAGCGELRFTVVMPSARPPAGGPPDVPGMASHTEQDGEQVVWAQEYGAFIPESLRPATAVHRVVIVDVDGPLYDNLPWFTPDHQLAEHIGGWFDAVRTWVEVVTGQDLDPDHRVYDVEEVGAGLTFVEPRHTGMMGLQVTTPRVRPLRAQEWARILEFVRDGQQPPLEETLSRDARAAHRRHADRRAIIDAATALEIALGRHVRSLAERGRLPEKQRKRINGQTALGGYISIAELSDIPLVVPIDRLHRLRKIRNDAVHRGAAPGHAAAGEAVQTMLDFLGGHGLMDRASKHEPDGGEWVPVDPEPGAADRSGG